MRELRRFPVEARRMVTAAQAFLASLEPEQRAEATAPFDIPGRRTWTYLPGARPGIMLGELTEAQQTRAFDLIDAGCSPTGAHTAVGIMELEVILRGEARRGHYWIRILGEPGGDEPWAFRINGHHLALHLTVVGDLVAVTPNFFGAQPATVMHGPHRGMRTLPDEEELARALLASLDDDQRQVAVTSPTAPRDIVTRMDPVADPGVLAPGLEYGQMRDEQQELVQQVIKLYVGRAPLDVANGYWHDAVDAGLDSIAFRWAGSSQRGEGHYYALNGPTFLIEYDNTQNDANHIHSVWRDLTRDWGEDLLAAHYAAHHQ
jgi:hypothetical protein